MTEAMRWSVMKWLREKKRVRKTADAANAALDLLDRETKRRWPEEFRAAYQALEPNTPASNGHKPAGHAASAKIVLSAGHMKEADDKAYRARMTAEKTFDDAEKQLSTSLAREGCRKAIESWDLHEKAIRASEALIQQG